MASAARLLIEVVAAESLWSPYSSANYTCLDLCLGCKAEIETGSVSKLNLQFVAFARVFEHAQSLDRLTCKFSTLDEIVLHFSLTPLRQPGPILRDFGQFGYAAVHKPRLRLVKVTAHQPRPTLAADHYHTHRV